MSVSNGQAVNAAITNAAFMSRTTNTSTTGVIDLNNTSDGDSGAQITNIQQAMNETFDAVGMTGIDDATRKNYSSNFIVTDGDDHKVAIGKIDTAVNARIVAPASTDNRLVRFNGTSGAIQSSGITIDDSDNITGVNDLTVDGNLTVSGTTTTIDTVNLDVTDKNITVNKGGDDASSEDAGITVERAGTDGSFVYEDALASKFKLGALAAEKEVADVSSTQTFTNKTHTAPAINDANYNGGTASNTKRILLPGDTTTNLDALTDTEKLIAWDTTLKKLVTNDGTGWTEVGGGGAGDHTPILSAFKTATQSIVTATATNITWSATLIDNDTIINLSTGVVTIPDTGDYFIYARANFDFNATGTRLFKILTGGDILLQKVYEPGAAIDTHMQGSWFGNLTATTLVAIGVQQDSGGNLNINTTDQNNCGFYLWRIT